MQKKKPSDKSRGGIPAKVIIATVAVILGMMVFSACAGTGGETGQEKAADQNGNLTIVTTIFPEADWTRNILGENPAGAELITLMDSGVDPHSFQPTTEDILTVSSCDVFIYVGGESDTWVKDALKEKVNPDMLTVNLLEVMGKDAREEEAAEGMQEDRGKIDLEFLEDDEPELDEHVWLSLRNASTLCAAIQEAVAKADPDHAEVYAQNLAGYQEKLEKLDEEYARAIGQAPLRTLLFGDRFPFLYLTEDYGLDYYAAFAGCSAETEASFETIEFLAKKLDELKLPAVLTIEGSDETIARTIIRSTKTKDQKILSMDSMQSVTAADAKAGTTYLSIMEKNLNVIEEALGQ